MSTITAGSLTVRLGKPVVVAEGIGHLWFPVIRKFGSGELMAEWSMMPDIHCFAYLSGASHSTDGGQTWSPPYSLGNHANQAVPQADGSLRLVPYYIYPEPAGQQRSFATDLTHAWPGGRRFETQPRGMRFEFPEDVPIMPTGAADLHLTGAPVKVGGGWVTTCYGPWQREASRPHPYNLFAIESRDDGRSWRYLSTIASTHDVPEEDAKEPPEGPDEAQITMLESGELLCVFRVGNYPRWSYRAARSRDGGKTWTKPEVLRGMGRVEPSLITLSNGALALSGGRPGIKLWLADDKVGKTWHAIDLLAHHNAVCEARERMDPDGNHTTAYTELIEAGPGKLLCIYDRCPMGWHPVPFGSDERGMVLVMPIEVK